MKRAIEESFPVKEVSLISAKEKNIRHGHISTLHIWWARRPLASSRATAYAALVPPAETVEDWNNQREFIINFSKWENSLDPIMIKKAREDILNANGGKPPKVLDPFAGGGSIPLEALRLGCETYSNDLNPVSVLIQKCTLEYPQKYGKPGCIELEKDYFGKRQKEKLKVQNVLLEDVKKWGDFILSEAKEEIANFYPEDPDGSVPVGYIWARTIPCQNPTCNAEIPLMRQFWLAKKEKKKVTLFPYVEGREVHFRIVGDGYEEMPSGFKPEDGTVARAVASCPVCGSVNDAKITKKLFQEGKSGQRMIAVVLYKPGEKGKRYRIATEKDMEVFRRVEKALRIKRESLMAQWGMDPVPDEDLPPKNSHRAVGSQLPLYDFRNWGDLFNSRQKLALITFSEKVRSAYERMLQEGYEEDYAKAVMSYLAIGIDRQADYNSTLSRWVSHGEFIGNTNTRQTLPMIWDYFELCPWSHATGDWNSALNWILRVIEHLSNIKTYSSTVTQSSATSLPYSDNYFDAVLTDPPYYDNVPYSYLSDFFYVWLKRTIGQIYPDLFTTPLTPKKKEIVAYTNFPGGFDEGKRFFEDMLKKSFQEIFRVLKQNGIAVIVYAHKSTAGWETLINSLLDSGLIMTGAWPINTEMVARLNARETAALASSIYIVCRKMQRQATGFYNDVKEALKQHLNSKLERLWAEGISGADFFIAAIGSAIEVFGKYEKVIDFEGNIIRADRLLEDVRTISTDYAVRKILHNGFSGEISNLTRFYVLYRWNYGTARIPFDEARKLAQSCSIDLAYEWNRNGFIKKDKEYILVLGPQDRKPEQIKDRTELIHILHAVLLCWEKSRRDEMIQILKESGYGKSEAFYRVAQAVSETLSTQDREKKLLDGFLAGRERLREDVLEDQGELFSSE